MVSVGSELTSFDTGPDSVYKIQGNEMEPKNLDPSHPDPNFSFESLLLIRKWSGIRLKAQFSFRIQILKFLIVQTSTKHNYFS